MEIQTTSLNRRSLLRGSLAAAVMVPAAGALASCATAGGNNPGGTTSDNAGPKTADNPFGVADNSTIDAVIFNGGYGYDYVSFAGDEVKKKLTTVTPKVSPSTEISQQLQPRFVAGNPPDLIDNSGRGAIGLSSILDQLDTFDDLFEANNYEGQKLSDTFYPGVKESGTFDGKFRVFNYALSLFGIWYSQSLFDDNGWTAPKTWDEALDLGAKAKAKGKYLWVWGKEAATYYQTLAIDSATKEGGIEVNKSLQNLEANCWSQDPLQKIFTAMGQMVSKGYFVPGGAGTQFTAAQAKWSNDQQALLYPSGSWIENEMKKATKSGFKMNGVPELTVTDSPKMPYEALRSSPGEGFLVPTKAKNVAGGKELLRAMLSKEAATNFSKTRLAPTVVKGLIPQDGFGSTALQSQSKMLAAAGTNIFDFQILGSYGMNPDQLVIWNTFLSGKTDAAGLTKGLQEITDKVRNDPKVKKLPA